MTSKPILLPEQSELGKASQYETHYNRDKLFPISRAGKRAEIGILNTPLPFFGYDLWNHYEVSWLNEKGKPIVAVAEILYNCETPTIIESKSMKLYFNSLNNTCFPNLEAVESTIISDLSRHLGNSLQLKLIPLNAFPEGMLAARLRGIYLDELDISCTDYHINPSLLVTEERIVTETLCSDLLKSNCLVTNQPDWCSIQITYQGKKICREGLLRYLVSFRNDNEFHEHCIEKIFMHLLTYCKPDSLIVYGRSTRRGGLDINSYRSTSPVALHDIANIRLCRQ